MNRLSSSAASHSFQARSSESHTHDPETSGGTAKNTPPHHDFFLEDSLSFASIGPPSGGQGSDVVFERHVWVAAARGVCPLAMHCLLRCITSLAILIRY